MRWQEHFFWNGRPASQAGCIWAPYSTLTTRCRSIRYELDLLLPAEWRFHLFYMLSNYILKFMVGGLEEKRPWLFSACVRNIMNNFFIFSQTQAENSDVIKLWPPQFLGCCVCTSTLALPVAQSFTYSHQYDLPGPSNFLPTPSSNIRNNLFL